MSDIDQRLAEIEARANAATPGPWYTVFYSPDGVMLQTSPNDDAYETRIIEDGDFSASAATVRAENGAFIASAREDVPWLIAELRAARKNDVAALARASVKDLLAARARAREHDRGS